MKKKSRKFEFSKKIILAIIVLWFFGAFFGAYMVWETKCELSSLLTYIGAPMAAGIVGYLLKSGFENTTKIANNTEDYDNGTY